MWPLGYQEIYTLHLLYRVKRPHPPPLDSFIHHSDRSSKPAVGAPLLEVVESCH